MRPIEARILNRQVEMTDATGRTHHGVVKEIYEDVFTLVNGDGTETFIRRWGIVSVRVLP